MPASLRGRTGEELVAVGGDDAALNSTSSPSVSELRRAVGGRNEAYSQAVLVVGGEEDDAHAGVRVYRDEGRKRRSTCLGTSSCSPTSTVDSGAQEWQGRSAACRLISLSQIRSVRPERADESSTAPSGTRSSRRPHHQVASTCSKRTIPASMLSLSLPQPQTGHAGSQAAATISESCSGARRSIRRPRRRRRNQSHLTPEPA